jgi:pimeloyl-ACP methyl ester carboxylesterase
MVGELQALLAVTQVRPPYLLAGRSLGGLNMVLFARHQPRKVAGLLLIDPWPEDMYASFPPEIREKWDANGRALPLSSVRHEFVATPASEAEAKGAGANPDVPAVVLIRGHQRGREQWRRYGFTDVDAERMEVQWQASLRRLAASFPRGRTVVAEHSGHAIHREAPALVTESLAWLLASTR